MAYQQGDTIQASDYNTFAGNVNTIIGTGSNDSGYGLSEIATISAGDTITAAQWNSLLSGLQKAANHQGTTITNASNTVSTGGNILPLSNLEADITLITTNKLTADAANMSTDTGVTATRTTSWTGTVNTILTVKLLGIVFGTKVIKNFWLNLEIKFGFLLGCSPLEV